MVSGSNPEVTLPLTPETIVALAVLLPFIAAAVAPVLRQVMGGLAGWVLALAPLAAFAGLWTLLPRIASGGKIPVSFAWAPSWGLNLSFMLDGLSLTFALTIAGVGALIVIYAGAYLKSDPHQGRFFSFLLMFMGAMQGLVLADNLVALYLFWELTSVTSFLLIGFDHSRQLARRAAIQALVVTGIGGLALLAAGVLIHGLTGNWELSAVTADLRSGATYPLLVGLVLLAAFTKSAQLPFHFWLPNAMEAPTPVSAYLHSATMVQGGVYLVARMTPLLGGPAIWNLTLMVFGGATLLWGALAALRQTDLKQILAQSTIASLGLLMLLLGVGTELALTGAVLYFLAHAAYKAALFLVAGAIDHGTGTRDITELGGLRDKLTVSFIGTIMASAGMIGLPPLLAFYAKEEIYAAVATGDTIALVALAVLVIGNVLLAVAGIAVLVRPFMGALIPTPLSPHEAPLAMLAGPLVLGVAGIGLGVLPKWAGEQFVAPAVSAISGHSAETHLGAPVDFLGVVFWLSVLTWALAVALYARFDWLRVTLGHLAARVGWSFDNGFDAAYFGLVRLAALVTRLLHHGRLELYLFVVFVLLAIAVIVPLWLLGGLPWLPAWPELRFYEWGVLAMAAAGAVTVVFAQTRLFAILALGIQGLAIAILYMLFGAPDLSFTQFMVEILSVMILALVMTRLRLDARDRRPLEDWLRDGGVALVAGLAIATLLFAVLEAPLDLRLSSFFNAHSGPIAHGHNVVNVILVDFRGLDTLGEIAVVMTAGIAVLALIRGARKSAPVEPLPASPPHAPGDAPADVPAKPKRQRKAKP
jgi:multicomponent Na+:H+ antiporter subunit A